MVDFMCGLDPNLLPASYAGVPFGVDKAVEDLARRIVTHEYPMSDTPYHEDLGERYREFTVTGYVAGADCIAQKEALKAACISRGAYTLQLPAVPAFSAVCLTISATASKDTQGVIDVTMKFRQDFGAAASPSLPIPVYEQLIASVSYDAVDPMTLYFDSMFSGFNVLPYVVDNLNTIIQTFADQVITDAETYPNTGSLAASAKVVQLALGIFQNAAQYVQPTGYAVFQNSGVPQPVNVFGQLTTPVAASQASSYTLNSGQLQPVSANLQNPYASAFVAGVAAVLDALYGILSPADAYTVMQGYASFSVGEVVAGPQPNLSTTSSGALNGSAIAPSDLANQASGTALNMTIRTFGLIAMARAAAAQPYATYADAVQARADLIELTAAQLDLILDTEAAAKLLLARDHALKAVSASADLSSVVEVDASSSMPSLYWAHRLYNDANRADELIDMNNVPMPCFMPTVFNASAS